jgi:hypothetical protein
VSFREPVLHEGLRVAKSMRQSLGGVGKTGRLECATHFLQQLLLLDGLREESKGA